MTEPYTPTTEDVRRDYAAMRDEHMYSPTVAKARAHRESGGGAGEFDRWLAEHDQAVRVEYEKRRRPDPIHIDNVDGKLAEVWLREHDAEVIERYADTFEHQGGRARDARNYAARIRRGEG